MSKLKALGKDIKHFFIYSSNFLNGISHQWKKKLKLKKHKNLEEIVKIAKKDTGKSKVNLVGHSFGGLKALVYSLENPEDVQNCTILGAPLNGTNLAYLSVLLLPLGIVAKSATQILPNNQFIKAIQDYFKENKETIEKITIDNFCSKSDELLSYKRTTLKNITPEDKNIRQYSLDGEGHVSMAYHPLVQEKIGSLITESEYPTIFIHGFAMEKRFFKKVLNDLKKKDARINDKKFQKNLFHFSYDYTERLEAKRIMEWYRVRNH